MVGTLPLTAQVGDIYGAFEAGRDRVIRRVRDQEASALQQARLGMDEQRLGLEQQTLDLQRQQFGHQKDLLTQARMEKNTEIAKKGVASMLAVKNPADREAEWQRVLENDVKPNSPEMYEKLKNMSAEQAWPGIVRLGVQTGLIKPGDLDKPAEAPESRTVLRGGRKDTEQWNPKTGAWELVGSGPAFAPKSGEDSLTDEQIEARAAARARGAARGAAEGGKPPPITLKPIMKNGVPVWVRPEDAVNQPVGVQGKNELSILYNDDGSIREIRQGPPRPGDEGAAPPEKSTRGKLQDELRTLEGSVDRVLAIDRLFDPEFLTYGGRASQMWLSMRDKIGPNSALNIAGLGELTPDQRKYLDQRRQFSQNVDRDFNEYRRYVTGAAAAVQELEKLKDAAVNMDLSPTEFSAAMTAYKAELLRSIRIARRLLREGYKVGDPKYNKVFNQLWTSRTQAVTEADADARWRELMDSGLSEEAAAKRMHEEGYR